MLLRSLDGETHGLDFRIPPDIYSDRRLMIERLDKLALRDVQRQLKDAALIHKMRWRTPISAAREYRRELVKIAAHIATLNERRLSLLYPQRRIPILEPSYA